MKKSSVVLFLLCALASARWTKGQTSVSDTRYTMERNPHFDIRTFGIRAVNTNTDILSVAATCVSGSKNITLDQSGSFRNGDGITVLGCGPANAMTTPSAPRATAVQAKADTSINGPTVRQPSGGSSTLYYKIFAIDQARGHTAASPEVRVTTHTLGSQSIALTSATRSNATIRWTASSINPLGNGAAICINGTSDDAEFGGCFNVASVNTQNNTFTISTSNDSRYGSGISAKGGTAYIFNGVQLALPGFSGTVTQYVICKGTRSGGETPYAMTLPNLSDAGDLIWNDYGRTLSSITLPWFVPSSCPSGATSDELTTTITSGAGSTSILVATGARTSASGTLYFDSMPNILSACSLAGTEPGGGYIRFPSVDTPVGGNMTYLTASYGALSCGVLQAGEITTLDTVAVNGPWRGDLGSSTNQFIYPQFALEPHIAFYPKGFPGVISKTAWRGVTFSGNGAGSLVFLDIDTNPHVLEDVVFTANGTYSGLGFYYYAGQASGGFGFQMRNVSILAGGEPSFGTTLSPACITRNTAEIGIDYISMSGRGCEFVITEDFGGFSLEFNQKEEEQGGGLPMLSFYNANPGLVGWIRIKNVIQDTIGAPLVFSIYGTNNFDMEIDGAMGGGSGMPLTSGIGFGTLRVKGANPSMTTVGQNVNTTLDGNFSVGGYRGNNLHFIGPTYVSAGQIANPSNAPVLSLTTTCPAGPLPAGTYVYVVAVWDATSNYPAATGNATLPSPPASIIQDGHHCTLIKQPTLPLSSAYWGAFNTRGPGSLGSVYAANGSACGPSFLPLSYRTITDSNYGYRCGSAPSNNSTILQSLSSTGLYGTIVTSGEATETQCFSAESPAKCGANIDGFVTIQSGSSSVVVDDTMVTGKSQIQLTFDTTEGANLGVTCNTAPQAPYISAKVAGSSFTISVPHSFSTYPGCIGFHIKN